MSKNEFIDRLAQLLADVSPEERDEALTYYREYIEDAGLENEEAILQELGSPEEIAAAIKVDSDFRSSRQPLAPIADTYSHQEQSYRQTASTSASPDLKDPDSTVIILTVILAVVLSPLWFPIIIAVFATLAGILIGALFGGIGCILVGISLFIAAVVCLFKSTLLVAFSLLGAGLLVAAIGILFIVLGVWLCATVIPWCATGIGKVFHKLFSRNKEAQA